MNEMTCAYCGRRLPWKPDYFPVRTEATCSVCLTANQDRHKRLWTDHPYWMARTMGAVCFGSALVALPLALLFDAWPPFLGAFIAGLIFTPVFMAWLESR